MTAPIESAPGAPSMPVFQQPEATSTTTATNWAAKPLAAGQPPTRDATAEQDRESAENDVSSLPEWAQKLLKETRDEAAKARRNARPVEKQALEQALEQARQEVAREVAKALRMGGDEPPTMEQAMERAEEFGSKAWTYGVRLHTHLISGELGADPIALLDSMSFIDSLDDLTDEDPDSPEFQEALKDKVRAALEKNPHYKAGREPATPRPDPSQGARGPAVIRPKSLGEAVAMHLQQQR